jgi:hypothetical protein
VDPNAFGFFPGRMKHFHTASDIFQSIQVFAGIPSQKIF